MFNSVLVANRGEIACRIIRTARKMGIRTIAIYCHEDRSAPHVALADTACRIDGDTPTASYLDGEAIVAAALASGAEAVHPGYGFLSENAGFARRVLDAGTAFVGPSPEAIRLMGDKIESREFAKRAGVPVAPSVTQDGDLADFAAQAGKIGFPLLIKAAAGGGGKGMSIVRSAGELAERAPIAASEAQRYFADGRIYAERLIERPRHIEVQIFGDGRGQAIHLGERECSVQRRFQKVVEESPAPRLSPALRDRICTAAVDLVQAARYANAGTVEFILAPNGEFYFLEMNTRLQVEHPVTEMVTGLDLVEMQFRIAAGEGIGIEQSQVRWSGHAIEVRICAEEPERDFAPAVGQVHALAFPEREGVRIDSGLVPGREITASFDSMLAKLIVHSPSREETARLAAWALDETVLLGVETNIDYLARIMRHPAFREGALHTGFLVEHAAELATPTMQGDELRAVLAAAALGGEAFRRTVGEVAEPFASMGGWRN